MLSRLYRRPPLAFSWPSCSSRSMAILSTRPQNWKAAAPEPPSGTLTFAAQKNLPRLPVPHLDATLERLKESIRPFASTSQEYAAAVEKIHAFAQGKGKELQERLLNHAQGSEHWLENWWDDMGYLGYRDSVVVNVSYYYGFDPQPSHLKQTPAARAAALARGVMIFRQQVQEGSIKPDATKEGPLCMDTFRWMFDCCRVPGPQGLDWSVSYADGTHGTIGHIIVIRKNRIWKLDTIVDGRLLSVDELERQIQHIYDNTTHEYPGVGVLTASNRDIWAKDYAELVSNPQNEYITTAIHSSAFIISLDSDQPSGPVDSSRSLWHGALQNGVPVGLRNRWVDKPVQFIVFDNAEAGIMGEHSVMDGTPTVRLCDDVLDYLHNPSSDLGTPSTSPLPPPAPLDWVISPATEKAVSEADVAARELIESQVLSYHLTKYGKAAIKQFGVSPDSWAQMIVQLAYRRLVGDRRSGGTYEAATTRKFYKGRTEAIRVVTSQSDAWAKSMDDAAVDIQEKKKLFDEATKKHIQLAKGAGNAEGVDRHLTGLKKVLREGEPLPSVFTDPLVARSSNWVLSTSAIFSKHFPVYGWGEVVPDGFGVAYMTGYDDRLQFTLTSRKESPNAEFLKEIARAAEDIYELHTSLRKARL